MIESYLNYIRYEKRYSNHTFISYQNDLNQFTAFSKDSYGLSCPSEASYQMIRAWIVTLAENEITPKSINRKIACLRSFYKYLLKQNAIQKDPTLRLKAPKINKQLPHFVEENDILKLLDQFKFSEDFYGLRDKLILELLYGTGIRLSELISIKEEHINKFERIIKIKGKGNKERIIPLNENLMNLINIYRKEREKVFERPNEYLIITDKGDQSYPMFIYRTVKNYLDIIPTLEKRSPHVLRHTFATHLLNKGADLNAIKDLLGHSSLAATQVYTHNSLDKLKAIFEQAHPKA
ncbi:MAG: tyrosine-type recombinase/integrase [Sporocytophaga sp.]|uniref:tyrosine-type recombinase/integrase n=1 Tax=Sporocytophaga sp. TaxID=2231183 RepID=UPI001AFF98D1|nr:tyrosine-type recombinase/integrase [Sporocytophaga sp.]MBO9702307.1 tyrosine-type recombinase/integrase [Sporocytophaga sp.]